MKNKQKWESGMKRGSVLPIDGKIEALNHSNQVDIIKYSIVYQVDIIKYTCTSFAYSICIHSRNTQKNKYTEQMN